VTQKPVLILYSAQYQDGFLRPSTGL